jgi:hypothetical protein
MPTKQKKVTTKAKQTGKKAQPKKEEPKPNPPFLNPFSDSDKPTVDYTLMYVKPSRYINVSDLPDGLIVFKCQYPALNTVIASVTTYYKEAGQMAAFMTDVQPWKGNDGKMRDGFIVATIKESFPTEEAAKN